MKLGPVLRELHRSEVKLGHKLLQTSERHKVDHEIYHVGRDLVTWSRSHIAEIARIGGDYGQDLDPDPRLELGLAEKAREKGSELIGRIGDADLLVLEDLRTVYMEASGVAMDWLLIAQAAQGLRHRDLLAVAEKCQPQTKRQAKWAKAKLKETATQILVS
ncbi:hypothetical protein [Dietzia lutea]|uniref:Uncharacterized protein n=1 Tax=Dietzia lutea TaxID=546160 RepID=A0A2S1R3U5_9ACTN|nr:hypothetical protein [Dietzia lutea]AWH90968.1 hypothetical protein A6035_00855 [Dietzia lutea]